VTWAKPSSTEAKSWIKKMAMNADKLNYSGIVSYQYGDVLVSAKMEQRDIKGKKHTRLVYLDGGQGGFIGEDNKVMFMGAKSAKKEKQSKQLVNSNIQSLPRRLSSLGDTYRLTMNGQKKVAGRTAVVVKMEPTDPFRYAHKLYIDKQTSLLLKTETMGDGSVPLERFQFMQVNLNPAKNDNFLAAIETTKKAVVSTMNVMAGSPRNTLDWELSWVPKGYSLVSSKKDSSSRESCLYTDGMSSFSVYVEPKTRKFKEGVMRQGASIVVSKSVNLKRKQSVVTVAGDIPITTAERIVRSVRGVSER
ncbi:MAG: MucB/RseB C-terminal domain-containing protein, partial [Pseudomonadota bacterium]